MNHIVTSVYGQTPNAINLQKLNSVTIQNTSLSMPAVNAKMNNQDIPHSIVVALPIRAEWKNLTGAVTFTASKPVEIEVLHKYLPVVKP